MHAVPLITQLCRFFGCDPHELLRYLRYKDRSFLYMLKDLKLYVVGTNQRVLFGGLTPLSARAQPHLPLRDVTVEEYYAKHGKILSYPLFPSITCSNTGKTEFFPLEVLYASL